MLCLCVVVMAYQPPTDLWLWDPEFQRVTERSSVPVPSTRASTGPSCPTVSASQQSAAASPVKSSKQLSTEQAVSTTPWQPLQPLALPQEKGKEGRSQCPVCDKKPNCSLRCHALVHLPWYGDPVKVCWECGEHFMQYGNLRKHLQSRHPNRHFNNHTSRWVTLLANLFHIITKHLQLSKVQDLVGYVIKHHLFLEPGEPSPDYQEMMCLFDITSGRAMPPQGYCYSPSYSVAALTHWKILVLLIQRLNPSCKQHMFNMQFSTIRSASGIPAPSPGVPSIFEISTAPVPGTRVATFSQPGPSQGHHVLPPVALGPSQDHHPPPLVVGLSKGPPQDCHAKSTVSSNCPQQDSSQPSPSSPLQDPWSILGLNDPPTAQSASSSNLSVCVAPVGKVSSVSPVAPGVVMPLMEPLLPDGQQFSYWGVDADFHPNKMLEEWSKKTLLEAVNYTPDTISFHLDWAFPFFAFPKSWPDPDTLTLPQQINRFALGWHPTRTSKFFKDPDHKWWDLFMRLQQHSAMKALGEIGLDCERAKNPAEQKHQREMLEYLCLYCHSDSCPILLHCWDLKGKNQANLDTLNILHHWVSPNTWIYLHCFSYSWEEFSRWNMVFPNVIVGITPKVLSLKDHHPDLINLIRGLETNWLLLETDAPYFGLRCHDYPKGALSQVFVMAQQVAEWCNSTPSMVLGDSAAATYQFYRL